MQHFLCDSNWSADWDYIFVSDLKIGAEGCLFLIANDLLWISLIVLVFCESRAYTFLFLICDIAHSIVSISGTCTAGYEVRVARAFDEEQWVIS